MDLQINEKELLSVINLNFEERYSYFIKKVADTALVWALYNEGWALVGDDQGITYLPFWPAKEYAELCAVNDWLDYKPESIDIHDFINNYLDEIKNNNIMPTIFLTPYDNGISVEVEKIKQDLNNELKKIE